MNVFTFPCHNSNVGLIAFYGSGNSEHVIPMSIMWKRQDYVLENTGVLRKTKIRFDKWNKVNKPKVLMYQALSMQYMLDDVWYDIYSSI